MNRTLKTQRTLSLILSLGLLVSLFTSCSEDEDVSITKLLTEEEQATVNDALANLGEFDQPAELASPEQTDEKLSRNEEDRSEECSVKTYKAAPGFDEMLALDPTSEVIYPGAMLKGESIPTGEYIGINGGRAPVTLSISLENINGKASTEIIDPKLSTVREGINSLLAQGVTGGTPAKLNFETEEVYSEQHLNIALGANYRSSNKSISSSFNFSNSTYKYRYVIKYLQIYYTIDLDLPDNDKPASLFNEVPDLTGTSPVIVSSVKYGRMVLYTVESNASRSEVNAAFSASFGSADGSVDAQYEEVLNSSSIKGIVIGGSGADAAKIVDGPQGVYEFITQGGNYSADSPGAPLAYTLRYIKRDFPIARLVLASEYPIRTCYNAYQKFRVELYGFNCVENDNEIGKVELYGFMSGAVYKNKRLVKGVNFGISANDPLGVDENFFYEVDKWMEVELYKPDINKDYVKLTSEFWEDDGRYGDDYFGRTEKKILLRDLPTRKGNYVRLNMLDDYQSDMRAYFYAWRIY
ncbi:MAG: thiol-activated cytolysin family protein [Bacteroidota bacterium]